MGVEAENQTNTYFIVSVAAFIALSWLVARAAASRSSDGENQEGSSLAVWWWKGAEDEDAFVSFVFLLALFYLIFYVEASWTSLMPVLLLFSYVFAHHYGTSFWSFDRVAWCCWSLSNVLLLCYRKQMLSWLLEPICKSLPILYQELKKPENCVFRGRRARASAGSVLTHCSFCAAGGRDSDASAARDVVVLGEGRGRLSIPSLSVVRRTSPLDGVRSTSQRSNPRRTLHRSNERQQTAYYD